VRGTVAANGGAAERVVSFKEATIMSSRITLRLAVLAFAIAPMCVPRARAHASAGGRVTANSFVAGAELGQPAYETPAHSMDDIIVKFVEDLSESDRDLLVSAYGCQVLETCEPGRFHRVSIPSDSVPEDLVAYFSMEEVVEYAELNHYASIFFEPNDPYYSYQWHLYNDATGGINTKAAWNIEEGDPNVIIAVIDTGIAYEDYQGFRMAPDLTETVFVPGYDFVNDDNHPNDDEGHGTHVAGTIAQSTNNDVGVAGVAFRCAVMPVKVLDYTGEGDYFSIAQGIYYAVDNGARVLSMSFGGPQDAETLEQAVAYAYQEGATVVCAAGNDYERGNEPSYPAAYDAYCIAVGAVRYDDTRAYYSNTGSYLDLAAPGGDLTVDQNHDGYPDGVLQQTFTVDPATFNYYFFQGTSMATPHVSGVAALLISSGVTQPDEVREAMEMTARDEGDDGWDAEYGWGVVDAYAALNYHAAGDVDDGTFAQASDMSDFSDLSVPTEPPAEPVYSDVDGTANSCDSAVLTESRPQ
jgi:serine protease